VTPSERLREILHASSMSQEALAARLGVSFPTLNSWINERSTPRAKALTAIEDLHVGLLGGATVDPVFLNALATDAESRRITVEGLARDRPLLDALTLALTYHTDAIEGSTMTMSDTEAVLFDGVALQNRTLVEQLEAKNHQAALWWLVDELRHPGFAVNEDLILHLHTRLMNGILGDAGRYRRHAVRIAGSRVTVANYMRVPDLVRELCDTHDGNAEPTIEFLARHHAAFERIHPFSDGNGRIGRLLLLALALQRNVVPPIIVRERRVMYYRALEAAQTSDDHRLLQQLIAESIISADETVLGERS
jgi:Fic family protein